jgi:putative membrane protein
MKSTHFLAVATVALGLAAVPTGAAYAQASDAPASDAPVGGTKLTPADQQFVQDASQADATEIAASKVALKNSSDPRVKKFAQQMITEHTKLSLGMAVLVAKQGFTSTPSADSALVGKLQTLKGKEFDQAYVEQIGVEAHQRAVDLFQQESQSGTNAQLKAAAKHALPTIKHHLEMAQQLAGAMKDSS